MSDPSPQEGSGADRDREESIRSEDSEQEEPSQEEAAGDQDAGPTATPEKVEEDSERDQAEG